MKYVHQINYVFKYNTAPQNSNDFAISFQPKGVDDNLAILNLDNHTISWVPTESHTQSQTYVVLKKVNTWFFLFSFLFLESSHYKGIARM